MCQSSVTLCEENSNPSGVLCFFVLWCLKTKMASCLGNVLDVQPAMLTSFCSSWHVFFSFFETLERFQTVEEKIKSPLTQLSLLVQIFCEQVSSEV